MNPQTATMFYVGMVALFAFAMGVGFALEAGKYALAASGVAVLTLVFAAMWRLIK